MVGVDLMFNVKFPSISETEPTLFTVPFTETTAPTMGSPVRESITRPRSV